MILVNDKNDIYELLKESRLEILEEIVNSIDKDPLNWSKGWDAGMIAPFNPKTNNYYSGGNILKATLNCQKIESKNPRWMTFLQIKEAGFKLKKGATSIKMEHWIFPEEILTNEKITTLSDRELTRIENKISGRIQKGFFDDVLKYTTNKNINRKHPLFNEFAKAVENTPLPSYFNVFNAKDIEGIEELKYPKMEESELWEIADDFILSCPTKVVEVAQGEAFTASDRKTKESIKIVLPPRETFENSREFLATLLHEMAHETGNKDLNREKGSTFGDLKYGREELVAEFTSIMIQGRLGLDFLENSKNNHTAYLQNWSKVIKNKTFDKGYKPENELFKALSEATKASNLIMDRFKEKRKELGKSYVDIIEFSDPKKLNKIDFNILDKKEVKGLER